MAFIYWLGRKLICLGIQMRPEMERQIWLVIMQNVQKIFQTVKPGESIDVHLTIEMQDSSRPWPNRESV